MRVLSTHEVNNISGGFELINYPICFVSWEPVVTTQTFITPVYSAYGYYLYDRIDVYDVVVDYIPVTVCY